MSVHFDSFLFYCESTVFEEPDFKGYMYEGSTNGGCTDVPDPSRNCIGSMKTTDCIVIYEYTQCHGRSDKHNGYGIVITSDEHNFTSRNFERLHRLSKIASFRDCTQLEKDSQVHLDFYDGHFLPFLTYRNVCTCTLLPNAIRHSADTVTLNLLLYGKCVNLHYEDNCNDKPFQIGKYGETGNVDTGSYQSFKPCKLPQHCVIMNAVLTQLEPLNDIINLQNLTNTVTIGATETFRNNGGGTLEEDYSVEKDIEENFQFGFAKEFSQMNSISFDVGVKIGVKSSFMGGLVSASAEIQEGLSTKYQSTSSSTETKEYGVKRTTKFKVDKKVIIPPCTEYKVGSTVQVAKDVEIDYRVEYKITGFIQPNIKMKSTEIRAYLGGMKYIKDVDEFTVLAETTALMKATFGLETFADAKGAIIAPCLKVNKQLMYKPRGTLMHLNNSFMN
ncbi:hypothetical protein Ocin01_16531 [Orchesella cincta]|uniref:Uncharacterized protein n=1 Tax=Orchesella cincta TaxID=48709 RepID=A0A1D2MB64_ORCCI|nr:hypothetical protein Ocin01_16531 [Orchesella cincta]